MNAFFQLLFSSSPAWGTFAVLFAVVWLAFRMERGFNNVKNEFTLVRAEMREGFLKVSSRHKRLKREVRQINKRLGNVEKTLKTP